MSIHFPHSPFREPPSSPVKKSVDVTRRLLGSVGTGYADKLRRQAGAVRSERVEQEDLEQRRIPIGTEMQEMRERNEVIDQLLVRAERMADEDVERAQVDGYFSLLDGCRALHRDPSQVIEKIIDHVTATNVDLVSSLRKREMICTRLLGYNDLLSPSQLGYIDTFMEGLLEIITRAYRAKQCLNRLRHGEKLSDEEVEKKQPGSYCPEIGIQAYIYWAEIAVLQGKDPRPHLVRMKEIIVSQEVRALMQGHIEQLALLEQSIGDYDAAIQTIRLSEKSSEIIVFAKQAINNRQLDLAYRRRMLKVFWGQYENDQSYLGHEGYLDLREIAAASLELDPAHPIDIDGFEKNLNEEEVAVRPGLLAAMALIQIEQGDTETADDYLRRAQEQVGAMTVKYLKTLGRVRALTLIFWAQKLRGRDEPGMLERVLGAIDEDRGLEMHHYEALAKILAEVDPRQLGAVIDRACEKATTWKSPLGTVGGYEHTVLIDNVVRGAVTLSKKQMPTVYFV